MQVRLEEFTDIVGRNFKEPNEGLGVDQTPSAHMWRTIIAPTKYRARDRASAQVAPSASRALISASL